jgi:hypothetical protein
MGSSTAVETGRAIKNPANPGFRPANHEANETTHPAIKAFTTNSKGFLLCAIAGGVSGWIRKWLDT